MEGFTTIMSPLGDVGLCTRINIKIFLETRPWSRIREVGSYCI